MTYKRKATALAAVMILATLAFGFTAGGATAQVTNFGMTGDSVTSDDGSLDTLSLSAQHSYSYNGLDTEAVSVAMTIQVQDPGGSWSTIAQTNTDVSGFAGTASSSTQANDVLANSEWTTDDFAATTDGSSKSTDLTFRYTVRVYDGPGGSGTQLAMDSDTTQATVTVTNEAISTQASATGGLDATATNQSP